MHSQQQLHNKENLQPPKRSYYRGMQMSSQDWASFLEFITYIDPSVTPVIHACSNVPLSIMDSQIQIQFKVDTAKYIGHHHGSRTEGRRHKDQSDCRHANPRRQTKSPTSAGNDKIPGADTYQMKPHLRLLSDSY